MPDYFFSVSQQEIDRIEATIREQTNHCITIVRLPTIPICEATTPRIASHHQKDPLAIYLIALIIEAEEQRGSSSAFDRTFSNFLGLCSLVPTSEREAKNADTQ